MAPHSSTLAWKIPWVEEPGGLQSMGSRRVGYDWATSLSLFTFMHWRRKWHPTPVFLPGESQGQGSLVGCRLWVRTESDTTELTQQQQQQVLIEQVWGEKQKRKKGSREHREVQSSLHKCFSPRISAGVLAQHKSSSSRVDWSFPEWGAPALHAPFP